MSLGFHTKRIGDIMKKVYMATLYRFGYELTVAAETEEKARQSLIDEYIKTYKDWNDGEDPADDTTDYGNTFLENAIEDIEVTEYAMGKVEWR